MRRSLSVRSTDSMVTWSRYENVFFFSTMGINCFFFFFSAIFIQQLLRVSHRTVNANIICILFISEHINAKLTKQIHITHNFLTLDPSDDVI